ncbi:MAG: hypothetical protein FWD67_12015, partial [Betaproteobacteria bacterium]|nr:hypothetical protein [Betaproteobacteria bacterium]
FADALQQRPDLLKRLTADITWIFFTHPRSLRQNKDREQALKNVLRPETVIALENVSFTVRAQALPGVEEVSYHFDEVLLTGDNPNEETIDVRRTVRLTPDIEERMIVLEKYVVAGGLAYDEDSEYLNPCEEGAANGSIFHFSTRRGNADEQRNYLDALGLDSNGNKDFSCEPVCDRLVKRVMQGIESDRPTLKRLQRRLRATGRPGSKASLESVIQYAIDQQGWECALDYLADSLWGVIYWVRVDNKIQDALQPLVDLFSESEVEKCWDEARAAGEVGNPLAIYLDIYEHGGVAYSVTGTGFYCPWDTSRGAAVWVPDEDAIDNIRSNVLSELGIGRIA